MNGGHVILIGASAGGVRALQILASQLPPAFPAPILVVQHIGSNASILPELLMRSGPLPASHALDNERVAAGRIHVAPPDHHMLLDGEIIRLSRGPKEHHTRPAIDPLFRSGAISWGPAIIGVLLTGFLDDGTAGLHAIKKCGGTAVVQDPNDAETPSMPLSALRYVQVDRVAPLERMAAVLQDLVARKPATRAAGDARIVHENEILLGKGDYMEHLSAIAKPSSFVCPDCSGGLWEIEDSRPKRYRCHTGHAFTLRSLQHAQGEATDMALWSAFRAMQEKEMLLNALAQSHRESDELDEANRLQEEADEIRTHAQTLRSMIVSVPAPPE